MDNSITTDTRTFHEFNEARPVDNGIKYWSSHGGLLLVEGWARDGLTEDQIAHNMGIHRSTLFRWQKRSEKLRDALKRIKRIERTGARLMGYGIEFWSSHGGLLLVRGWVRDGLTEEQIAYNMGINGSTLFRWRKRSEALHDALRRYKENGGGIRGQ